MTASNPTKIWRALFAFTMLGLALLLATSSVAAASKCKKVAGKFTLTPVSGPACASEVGVCATGSYIGVLQASSAFIGTSFVPTHDVATTGVFLLTGNNTITTATGTISTQDAIVLKTSGAGEFAEVDTVIGGTGAWANASGTITAEGYFGSEGGAGVYMGEICTP